MRKLFIAFLVLSSVQVFGQATPAAKAPVKRPAAAPVHPTAIIDTTAGKMTCTLFPDKAPRTSSGLRKERRTGQIHPLDGRCMVCRFITARYFIA